jgi:hypothetical protein
MPETPATPATRVAHGGKEHARSLLKAAHVLQIYYANQPDSWKRVAAAFPDLANTVRTEACGASTNFIAGIGLASATGAVEGYPAKQPMTPRVFQEIASIVHDAMGKATNRLSALKLLG